MLGIRSIWHSPFASKISNNLDSPKPRGDLIIIQLYKNQDAGKFKSVNNLISLVSGGWDNVKTRKLTYRDDKISWVVRDPSKVPKKVGISNLKVIHISALEILFKKELEGRQEKNIDTSIKRIHRPRQRARSRRQAVQRTLPSTVTES